MGDVFVVSAARTPVGKNNGYLRGWCAPELLAVALDEVLARIKLEPALVDEVITGCVYQLGEQGFNLARMGILSSTLPVKTPGVTVNRQCGSSLTAIQMAHMMIVAGDADVVIASGCELMSKYTIMSDMNGTLYNGQPMNHPVTKGYLEKYGMPDQIGSAQKIANKFGITKDQCQQFAVASHQKAHKATNEGRFKKEIMPMKGLEKDGGEITRDTDETIRPDTTIQKLEALKILPNTEWMTPGLSSTITDGSSAVILMSERKVKELKLEPLARIVANVVVGSDPELMLTGPIPATQMILAKTGMAMKDIDIFEVNEAFAPIPLAWAKELKADMDKLNVNGGAMALGHPVGNSGCRLSITAIHELHRRKARYALVTLCTGGGQAPATIFERV